MTVERWQEIERLYHSARLHGNCVLESCDPELRDAVERLLAHDATGQILDRPVAEVLEDLSLSRIEPSLAGRKIAHYEILELLGAGGMGVVYKAQDTKLNRHVALKFLPPELRHDQELRRRLAAEAQAASTLIHPHIVVIHEIHDAADEFFMAMAFHDGMTLRERMMKPICVDEALHITRAVAAGLAAAHASGIIHRDIKPSNIMVGLDGIVRIIDFGLAQSSATMASVGAPRGTPLYMSPEQASGNRLDCRTDLWSLGVVLHHMLSGEPPFRGENAFAVMRAVTGDKPGPLPHVPEAVSAIVRRALEKDPARRYQSASQMEAELCAALESPSAARHRPLSRFRPRVVLLTGLLAALTAAGIAYHRNAPRRASHALQPVVLADTLNTADHVASNARLVREHLALQVAPVLNVLSDERMRTTLDLMRRAGNTTVTPEIARDICERTSSKAVIESTVSKLGSDYFLHLRARNCATGEIISQNLQRGKQNYDVLRLLDDMAVRFRTETIDALARVEPPPKLQEATTTSLEALKSYSAALEATKRKGFAESVVLVERAVNLDPGFAMAWSFLGRLYSDMGESARSEQAMKKAYALLDRVSDRENFFVTYNYQRQILRNLELGRQTLEAWVRKYPRDSFPLGFLSGLTALGTGKYESGIEAAKRSIELNPDASVARVNLIECYTRTGRLEEATAAIGKALESKSSLPELYLFPYFIAFLRGDEKAMEQAARERLRATDDQGLFLYQEASVLACGGRLREARIRSAQAISLAEQSKLKERSALFRGGVALWEALLGKRAEAKRDAFAALKLFRGRDVDYGPAFALVLAGEVERGLEVAHDMRKHYPEDTPVQFKYVPTIQAMAALKRGAAKQASDLSLKAGPYEFAQTGTSLFAWYGTMDPVYVRGLAYVQEANHAAAAAEFQKIVEHPGILLSDPVGPLARLQLARSQKGIGERAKAIHSYKQFLEVWKSADADLPALAEAKAELESLERTLP